MNLLGSDKTQQVVAFDDLKVWLADHGFAMENCFYAQIRLPAGPGPQGVPAWLDVEYWKLNEKGERFLDWDTREPAKAAASVPLKSWPPLTPATP